MVTTPLGGSEEVCRPTPVGPVTALLPKPADVHVVWPHQTTRQRLLHAQRSSSSRRNFGGLFAPVGTKAGLNMRRWCPARGSRIFRRNLLTLRSREPGGLVIDVGAFDGNDAVLFSHASRQHVWTFEPTPSKQSAIRHRLLENSMQTNVTLFPMALSNRSGKAAFELLHPTSRSRRGTFGSAQDLLVQDDRPEDLKNTDTQVISVPICTLDQLLMPSQRVYYMKIDAQGFDTLVLRGAERLLAEGRVDTFAFEFSPFLMPGRLREAREALTWLEALSFKCVPCGHYGWSERFGAAGAEARWDVAHFVEQYRNTTWYDDIVCQPLGRLKCAAEGAHDMSTFDKAVCSRRRL